MHNPTVQSASFCWGTIMLACAAAFLEGYDLQLLSVLVPTLSREWGVEPHAFGVPMSATFVGFALGGILIAPTADRIGHRPVFASALLLSGLAVASCAFAGSILMLTCLRFVAGVGIGTALIIALAMITQATPPGRRATMITFAMTAIAVGGICSGLLASAWLSSIGWQTLFLIGGGSPALLAIAAIFSLSASPRQTAKIETQRGVSVLLSNDLRRRTILIWLLFLLASFLMYYLASWWPTLFVHMGWTPSEAARATALPLAASIVGGFFAAWFIDRGRARMVVPILYCGALLSVAAFFWSAGSSAYALSAAVAIGFTVGGAQFAVSAMTLLIYPEEIRATGAGWAGAIARTGTILAPLAGGFAIATFAPEQAVALLAVPILIALAVAVALGREFSAAA